MLNNEETVASLSAKSKIESQSRLARVLRVEWLGQTAASIFWMASVFTYGISSSGDWLQLFAASAWFAANISAVVTVNSDKGVSSRHRKHDECYTST